MNTTLLILLTFILALSLAYILRSTTPEQRRTFRARAHAVAVYVVSYVLHGKEAAESDALTVLGENKMSAVLKDQPGVAHVVDGQDELGATAGGLVDNKSPLGGVGQGASNVGDAVGVEKLVG